MSAAIVAAIALLAFLGTPLFVLIGGGALAAWHWIAQIDVAVMVQEINRLAAAPALTALPLFTFAGFVMAESGTPRRLVEAAQAVFGWMPGGLAAVSLAAAAIFTALTGASGVTIVALGGLLLPALLQDGYPRRYAMGLLTTSGSLGLLFPPSLPLILYALVATLSLQHYGKTIAVDDLFLAGILPGLLIVLLLIIHGGFIARRAQVARHPFEPERIRRALWEARWELPIPFIVLGGIYGGLMTASDAAAIMAVLVVIVEVFLYRDLPLRRLPEVAMEAMILIGSIFLILGVALGFTGFLVDQQVPNLIFEWMHDRIHTQVGFLLFLNVFLLVVGCLMDIFSAIVVVVPLILPIAIEFGVDPVHLGIVFLTNLEIGYSTPPVGMNLFLASFRFDEPITRLYRASIPFLLLLLVALLLITYVPALSLWWR